MPRNEDLPLNAAGFFTALIVKSRGFVIKSAHGYELYSEREAER